MGGFVRRQLSDVHARRVSDAIHGRRRGGPPRFQDPKNLEGLPQIPYADLMDKMHVVAPDGRIFKGAAAIARVAALTPIVGKLALLYYVPGIRQLADFGYAQIAKRRYRLNAKDCADGTCKLHAH